MAISTYIVLWKKLIFEGLRSYGDYINKELNSLSNFKTESYFDIPTRNNFLLKYIKQRFNHLCFYTDGKFVMKESFLWALLCKEKPTFKIPQMILIQPTTEDYDFSIIKEDFSY